MLTNVFTRDRLFWQVLLTKGFVVLLSFACKGLFCQVLFVGIFFNCEWNRHLLSTALLQISSLEFFSSVKVSVLCKQLVNMSQTILIRYIQFFTSLQDATEWMQLTTSCLTPSGFNHKNIYENRDEALYT